MRVLRVVAFVTAALAIGGAALRGEAGPATPPPLVRYELTEPHMGTTFRLVFYARSKDAASEAARAAFARIDAIDRALSDYRRDSELMRVCGAAGGEPQPVSEDFVAVWRVAREISAATGGAFDVTAGPLTRLWRRARRLSEWPQASEIEAARSLTDGNALEVRANAGGGGTARLARAGMCLDFGGIAKGYAAAEALAVIRAHGIKAALAGGGGDLAIGDPPPGTDGWIVTVAPVGGAEPPIAPLSLSHVGVSTSGDAEQWLEVNGVRYSHVIDPRTGIPLTGRRSVTVIARDATWSDALATAVSVAGREAFAVAARLGAAATLTGIERADGRVEWSASRNWERVAGQAVRPTATARIHGPGIH